MFQRRRCFLIAFLQDFDTDPELKNGVRDLLEDMINNTCLLPAEHKAALSILYVLNRDDEIELKSKVDLELLLAPPEVRPTWLANDVQIVTTPFYRLAFTRYHMQQLFLMLYPLRLHACASKSLLTLLKNSHWRGREWCKNKKVMKH